ncbi:MAG: tetratricopeptide repeat protein [Planctomycetota bacterium]|jgi:tetratricopeptide (TPR) repeat protein
MADVSKLFDKAEDAVKRRSYDMAIDLYQQILVIDADSERARFSLRETELKKVNEMGSPSKLISSLLTIPALFKGGIYRTMKKPDLATVEYEKILAHDPRNEPISFQLGKALEASGCMKSALATYRGITLWDPGNVSAFLAAGAAARRLGRTEEALEYYSSAKELNPKEKTASDAVRDLSAMISLKPREEASSFRDLIKKPAASESGPAGSPSAAAEALDVRIEELKRRCQEVPDDKDAILELSAALDNRGDLKGLAELLNRAVKDLPDDRDVRLRFREANLTILEVKLGRLESKGATPEEIDELEKKVRASKKALYKAQIEKDPSRTDARFHLGLLCFEEGGYDEAISNFQQVKKDPKRSRNAAFWLGRGFLEKGKFSLAANQLESAVSASSMLDASGKETLYYLGQAKIKMGEKDEARKHFERIYEEDINFRDVGTILEEME